MDGSKCPNIVLEIFFIIDCCGKSLDGFVAGVDGGWGDEGMGDDAGVRRGLAVADPHFAASRYHGDAGGWENMPGVDRQPCLW